MRRVHPAGERLAVVVGRALLQRTRPPSARQARRRRTRQGAFCNEETAEPLCSKRRFVVALCAVSGRQMDIRSDGVRRHGVPRVSSQHSRRHASPPVPMRLVRQLLHLHALLRTGTGRLAVSKMLDCGVFRITARQDASRPSNFRRERGNHRDPPKRKTTAAGGTTSSRVAYSCYKQRSLSSPTQFDTVCPFP